MNFLSAQGYNVQSNVVYQDNESAIRMEKNGRNSCTGNSRHIHIRYFFVKDRVDKDEVIIKYCPTMDMLADFFTKPLQGKLFHKFRDVIMGWKHINTLHSKKADALSPKERVENTDQNVRLSPSLDKKGNVGKINYIKENSTPTYANIVNGKVFDGRESISSLKIQ